jgi:hypothetical protein
MEGVSITRKEYRHAYDLFLRGNLKIISFVRKDVWVAREDRKGLQKQLSETAIDSSLKEKLVAHESRVLENPQLIFDFLSEVGRNAEMKKAIEGVGQFPKGNRLHVFDSFSDVMQALNVEINIKSKISDRIMLSNLEFEVVENLKTLFWKYEGVIQKRNSWGLPAKQKTVGRMEQRSTITKKDLVSLILFCTSNQKVSQLLKRQQNDLALGSGLFLTYDVVSGQVQRLPAYELLLKIQDAFLLLKGAEESCAQNPPFPMQSMELLKQPGDSIVVDNIDLMKAILLFDKLEDIANLYLELFRYFNGEQIDLERIQLSDAIPKEVFPDIPEKIEYKIDELKAYLKRYLGKRP